MKVTESILWTGVHDHAIDLFEGQYRVPKGMSYNSYVILDTRPAVLDTADARFAGEWLGKVEAALDGREPEYLIIQHVEPDHSGSILSFMEKYPKVTVAATPKAFPMLKNFYGLEPENRLEVKADTVLSLGTHTLRFVPAPMVHWPEVTLTYDETEKVLFSADAFGKFGAWDTPEPWEDEARRYYIGIVGKFGGPVQALLKKAAALEIAAICPLHGPVLQGDLSYYLKLYDIWSSYRVESDGVVIAYTSVYGNTKKAAELLAAKLEARGVNVTITDLLRDDMAEAVEAAFRYGALVLASTTYNAGVFPAMREFIEHLTDRGFRSRTVALMENGSWAPMAAKVMKGLLEGCKDIAWAETTVRIQSALNAESEQQLEALADELCGA